MNSGHDMEEFFKGLSDEDAKLAADDLIYFGTAYAKVTGDGKKVRIPLSHVAMTSSALAVRSMLARVEKPDIHQVVTTPG